ncbi:MAG: hypothetical protein P8Y16_08590 [Sulfurimonas sp.]
MVKSNSTSRLFGLNTQIVLTQTDTTVGFISHNATALASIKIRPNTKPFIKVYRSLKNLKQEHKRVPNKFKKDIRLSTQTTFIVKDEAFRIAAYPVQSNILRNLQWSFSTSANESGKNFNREFCQRKKEPLNY